MNILEANMAATSGKSEKLYPRDDNELEICTYSAKEGPQAGER